MKTLAELINECVPNIDDTVVVVRKGMSDTGWDRKLLCRKKYGTTMTNIDGFGCLVADFQLTHEYEISANQTWEWGWDPFEMRKIEEPNFETSYGGANAK